MILASVLMLLVAPSLQADSVLRVTDFDGVADWRIVNDTVMGGRSRSQMNLDNGVMRFTGYLNTNGGGFASARMQTQDWDLRAYAGVRVRARGDGREYQIRLRTRNSRASYRHRHVVGEQWQIIEVPFSAFQPTWRGRRLNLPPPAPGQVSGVGIMLADGQDGTFSVELDWIEFVPAHNADSVSGLAAGR